VPIAARGEVIGAMSAVRAEGRRPFDEGLVELLFDLARRVAVHLHNVRLNDERDAAEAALRDTVERLRRLQTLTDLAFSTLPLDDLIAEVMRRVKRVLNADTVRVLLVAPDGASLRGGGGIGLDPGRWNDELPVGAGFAGFIAQSRRPLVVHPAESNVRFLSPAIRDLAMIAGVPLLVGDQLVGVLHVGSKTPRGFDDEDLQLLRLAADRIAIAIDQRQRLEQERRKTLRLQQSLLPDDIEPIPGCELVARYWPADDTMSVGGDFYDVFPLSDGRYGVLIGDISGKGVEAAALTGLARNTVRVAARHTTGIEAPLHWLHDAMMSSRSDEYCTALFGMLVPDEECWRFEFAIGGHPLPRRLVAFAPRAAMASRSGWIGRFCIASLPSSS